METAADRRGNQGEKMAPESADFLTISKVVVGAVWCQPVSGSIHC
jgi:hypothetical protein